MVKDVFLAKPATLTIDEGKQLWKAAQEESKRVIGINTQQRSDERFLKAVAMCQLGRIGKIHRVTCAIGDGPSGGPFGKQEPPPELDWNLWLGPAPKVDYRPQRCHGNFRWWYEYSGGKLTDWGAHHVDIAQWAIGMDRSGRATRLPSKAPLQRAMKRSDPMFEVHRLSARALLWGFAAATLCLLTAPLPAASMSPRCSRPCTKPASAGRWDSRATASAATRWKTFVAPSRPGKHSPVTMSAGWAFRAVKSCINPSG
ncbi:MAG: hypothetical protein FJ280_22690 [Planctomycetes bacterium]|nr:hypothetical protein [Planctomycetota bacterium]